MIRQIEIEGFKSIDRLKFRPGRVTVLIGENGCGKSNILEAIAMASAAAAGKLDHEFLAPRGIRVTNSRFMVPAFPERASRHTRISIRSDGEEPVSYSVEPTAPTAVSGWRRVGVDPWLEKLNELLDGEHERDFTLRLGKHMARGPQNRNLDGFLIFSPENSALRRFQVEGQILPLGIRGEGLFAHLRQLRAKDGQPLDELSDRLKLIDWFDGFAVPADLAPGEHRLDIRDRYLDPIARFDQRSANEGFLFLLFYFTLLISSDTPPFFAIDNVDASLNPRLCARLMREITTLAKAHDKQVIVTTHNPAILDGLNLEDDEQRLFVVGRKPDGPTRIRRIKPPRPIEGAPPMRLSEAFIWGHLGGLPTNF